MKAIVLAAGLGTRLGKLTDSTPKSIIEVNDKKILSYTLSVLKKRNIETILVTGYQNNIIEDFVSTDFSNVSLVHNPNYKKGSILSLLSALPKIDDDFILLNADHIYQTMHWEIFTKSRDKITGMCDFDRTLTNDDMKVKTKGNRIASISKTLSDYNGGYIGVTYCPKIKLGIYNEAAHVVAGKDNTLPVEAVLSLLISKSEEIEYADASGSKWWEVDTAEDLMKANQEVRI